MAENYEYLDDSTKRYLYVAALIYKKLKRINPQISSIDTDEKTPISTEGKKLLSLLLACSETGNQSEMKRVLDSNSFTLLRKNLYDIISKLSINENDAISSTEFNKILASDFFDVLNNRGNETFSKTTTSQESIFMMYYLSHISKSDIAPIYTLLKKYDLRNKTSGSIEKFNEYIYRIYSYTTYGGEIKIKSNNLEDLLKEILLPLNAKSQTTTAPKVEPSQASPKTKEKEDSKKSTWEILDGIKAKFIGQERLAKELFYNIINNQFLANQEEIVDGERSIIFIDGPTGTGKTAITREITKCLDIPFTSTSITSYSSTGYVGGNITDTLVDLYKKANGNIKKAEKGIIVLDEFDKIISNGRNGLEMKRAVQQQLLDFLGGGKYIINVGDRQNEKLVEFDTSRLTFVCLGALTDLRTKKTDKRFEIGFDSNNKTQNNGTYTIRPEDLIELGIEKELVGRFNTYLHTDEYNKNALERILRESSISPIKGFEKLLSAHGMSLKIDEDAYGEIASSAYNLNTGARSLQTIVNIVRNEYLEKIYNGSIESVHLTKDNVESIVQDSTTRRERG